MDELRALTDSYRPLLLMSSSMPDRRRVSLAPVNTVALGNQVLDAGTRGGGVIEDLDGEVSFLQRGGHPLQALGGSRFSEQCCWNRGNDGASWLVVLPELPARC
ncbi:MAG: hypothetical protein M3237_14350 [Actinomycetota bacterium]|nr:hypothetical protein [Actinomycetota bacterium]